jgi:hypothetical protein
MDFQAAVLVVLQLPPGGVSSLAAISAVRAGCR